MARTGNKIPEQEKKKFHLDVDRLHMKGGYFFAEMARKMGKKPSNFANYRNGRHKLTPEFLILFYNAWGKELERLRLEEEKGNYPHNGAENLTKEWPVYSREKDKDAYINHLETTISHQAITISYLEKRDILSQKRIEDLQHSLDEVIKINGRLTEGRLEQRGEKPGKPGEPESGQGID